VVAKLEAPPNAKGELVPVEVPPPGARLLPKMGVAAGGFCEKMGALVCWDDPPKLKAGPDVGPPNETDC
jgi:hypothetical protein